MEEVLPVAGPDDGDLFFPEPVFLPVETGMVLVQNDEEVVASAVFPDLIGEVRSQAQLPQGRSMPVDDDGDTPGGILQHRREDPGVVGVDDGRLEFVEGL